MILLRYNLQVYILCFVGFLSLLLVLQVQGQRPSCAGTGANVFEQFCIVPDVIDQAPTGVVQVKYSPSITLNNGNEVKPEEVKDAPFSVVWDSQTDNLYTLSNVDPDANRSRAPINHWLVVNIPGGNISQGDELMSYRGSRPPKDSGIHRYVFLVYKQAHRLDVASNPKLHFPPNNRTNFEIRAFAAVHNLGSPIAGNFYQAQYSDYLAQFYGNTTG